MSEQTEVTRIKRINYRSDFDFRMILRDAAGDEILPVPEYDFTVKVYTVKPPGNLADYAFMAAGAYVASQTAGRMTNCGVDEDGRLHVYCDRHRLSPGRVVVEFSGALPEAEFADGSRTMVVPELSAMELVRDKGDLPTGFDVELGIPAIRVESGSGGLSESEVRAIAEESVSAFAESLVEMTALEAAGIVAAVSEEEDEGGGELPEAPEPVLPDVPVMG